MVHKFESMVATDCQRVERGLQSETYKYYNLFCPTATVISFLVGFLILWQRENRQKYPHRIIGYICLTQAVSLYCNFIFTNWSFCEMKMPIWLLKTTLLSEDTLISNLTGIKLFPYLSDLTCAGMIQLTINFIYDSSLIMELIFTVVLNLDLVSTLTTPF